MRRTQRREEKATGVPCSGPRGNARFEVDGITVAGIQPDNFVVAMDDHGLRVG